MSMHKLDSVSIWKYNGILEYLPYPHKFPIKSRKHKFFFTKKACLIAYFNDHHIYVFPAFRSFSGSSKC